MSNGKSESTLALPMLPRSEPIFQIIGLAIAVSILTPIGRWAYDLWKPLGILVFIPITIMGIRLAVLVVKEAIFFSELRAIGNDCLKTRRLMVALVSLRAMKPRTVVQIAKSKSSERVKRGICDQFAYKAALDDHVLVRYDLPANARATEIDDEVLVKIATAEGVADDFKHELTRLYSGGLLEGDDTVDLLELGRIHPSEGFWPGIIVKRVPP